MRSIYSIGLWFPYPLDPTVVLHGVDFAVVRRKEGFKFEKRENNVGVKYKHVSGLWI